MKTIIKTCAPVWLFLLWLPLSINGQDAFFTHFYNNRSYYNPAMTGVSGGLSLSAKHKSQWQAADVPAFISTMIAVEETVPCHFMDYGFFMNYDREGAGIFETLEPGFRVAAALAFSDRLNLRLGGTFGWGWKRIDYSRLIFSDQLDPRYGFTGQASAFIPPNDGISQVYLNPGAGFVLRAISNPRNTTIYHFDIGAALHHGLSIGSDAFGHTASILGLDARIPIKWNAFLDFTIFQDNFAGNNGFWSINPQVMYQSQAQMDYLEAGLRLGFNRRVSTGFFYHQSKTSISGANNTQWFTANIEVGTFLGNERRVDLGFSWSSNMKGLRNLVGPIYELSFSYHLLRSPVCSLFGQRDPWRGNNTRFCPPFGLTAKNKIYDNIWYK